MKEKKTALQIVKKVAIILFCIVTISMNLVNYLRGNEFKGLGTVYQWSREAENAGSEQEIAYYDGNDDDEEPVAETDVFFPVNLNTAGEEELQTLSGIGPSKASAIIEYREKYGSFVALEEIMQVPGIGEGIYAKIKDYICID